jgi:hypothetical protein
MKSCPLEKSAHLLVCSSAKCHEFFAAALTLPASVLNVRVYLDHQLVFDTVYGSGFFYFQNSTDNFYFLPMRDQTFNINVKHRQLLENFYINNEKTT